MAHPSRQVTDAEPSNGSQNDPVKARQIPPASIKVLTLFGFFSITASMLMSADEYPAFALSGFHAVFYLVVGGILWFLPVALCSAELASVKGWEEGGVFSWVGNTLDQRAGFIAIFFQWFQITVGFVTMIYFIEGSLSYLLGFPALNTNPIIKVVGFFIVYWIATALQVFGIRRTASLVKICFLVGIVVPAVFQIFLAGHYILSGGAVQIHASASSIFPQLSSPHSLVAFLPFILAYTGIEASASHVNEMKNPARDYPLTLMLLVVFAILLDSLGGLSVAAVIPKSQLSLNSGLVQSLQAMLATLSPHLGWLVATLAGLMAFGMLGEISSWIVGPVRGLYATAKIGILPAWFDKLSKTSVPLRLVIVQGVIVSACGALITLFGGSSNGSYALAISLTVMVYLVVYILIFAAYIKMKMSKQEVKRTFRIPGGRGAGLTVATVGLIVSIIVLALTFVPTSQQGSQDPARYAITLGIGFLISLAVPNIIYQIAQKKKRIKRKSLANKHLRAEETDPWTILRGRGEHHIVKMKDDIEDRLIQEHENQVD